MNELAQVVGPICVFTLIGWIVYLVHKQNIRYAELESEKYRAYFVMTGYDRLTLKQIIDIAETHANKQLIDDAREALRRVK